jgi:hypothetical protein
MLGVGMAGKMRFSKGDESGYAAFALERMPDLVHGLEAKVGDDLPEN